MSDGFEIRTGDTVHLPDGQVVRVVVDERPNSSGGISWVGHAYPTNADPERDTWNGQPIKPRPTLADFLLARIAEDERAATREAPDPTDPDDVSYWEENGEFTNRFFEGDHVRRWSPTRVLAECDAKRRIIEHDHVECAGHPGPWMPHADYGPGYCGREDESNGTLLALALPYAGHPDYRGEWRP